MSHTEREREKKELRESGIDFEQEEEQGYNSGDAVDFVYL